MRSVLVPHDRNTDVNWSHFADSGLLSWDMVVFCNTIVFYWERTGNQG